MEHAQQRFFKDMYWAAVSGDNNLFFTWVATSTDSDAMTCVCFAASVVMPLLANCPSAVTNHKAGSWHNTRVTSHWHRLASHLRCHNPHPNHLNIQQSKIGNPVTQLSNFGNPTTIRSVHSVSHRNNTQNPSYTVQSAVLRDSSKTERTCFCRQPVPKLELELETGVSQNEKLAAACRWVTTVKVCTQT